MSGFAQDSLGQGLLSMVSLKQAGLIPRHYMLRASPPVLAGNMRDDEPSSHFNT